MTDPVSGKSLAQEFLNSKVAQRQAMGKAEKELENDGIDDQKQEKEFQALQDAAKSLEIYPRVKANGQLETTQEFEAQIRPSLEEEQTSIGGSLEQLTQKQVNLAERIDLLESLNRLSEEDHPNLEAAFTLEERANLLTRGQRIDKQKELESQLASKDVEEPQRAILQTKIEALKTITEAEDEKLTAEALKPEELQTETAITAKLADTTKQQESLEKVKTTLEARKEEVERLQALGNTPEAEGTPGSQDDSNPQAQPQADDGGCPDGNCGRQRGRGRAKATIMAVAATELAALQIDYSQFLS